MEKAKKISGECSWAIETFRKMLIAQKRSEKLNEELERLVINIPAKDMAEYIRITEKLERIIIDERTDLTKEEMERDLSLRQ